MQVPSIRDKNLLYSITTHLCNSICDGYIDDVMLQRILWRIIIIIIIKNSHLS